MHGIAVVTMVTLFAGDAVRNLVSWYGFAVWVALLLAAILVVVPRSSGGPRDSRAATIVRQPALLLVAFLVWAAMSLAWSEYRLATMLAIVVALATGWAGFALFSALGWSGIVRALSQALIAVMTASFAFEFVVAAFVRRPVLPVFPIDVEPRETVPQAFYWSRALLFDGGRIQGVVGNANLFGFIALVALVVVGCQWTAGQVGKVYGISGVTLSIAALALTRSSTVIACAIVAGVVLLFAILFRRRPRATLWSLAGLLAAGGAGVLLTYPWLLTLLGKSDDLTGRLDIWGSVASLFLERPILGWGWTSYWQPWVPLFQDLAVRNGVVYLQAHNAYLDVAFQLGVIGLALFLAFLIATCVSIARGGVGEDADDGTAQRIVGKLLPALLLTALLTQAFAESRLLIEGNWALIVIIAVASSRRISTRTGVEKPPELVS